MVEDIPPTRAWEILNSDSEAVLLDVRSSMEYDYVGHPPDAVLVPWKEPPDWEIDPGFVEKVRRALGAGAEKKTILCLCRSGARSRSAGERLLENGFRRVLNVAEGFEGDKDENLHRGNINGWRFHGLPWEQG